MGCVSSIHLRSCENPANDFNSQGLKETISDEGAALIQSKQNQSWKIFNLDGNEDSYQIIYVFPMLNCKISRLILSFYYWGTKNMIQSPTTTPSSSTTTNTNHPKLFLELLTLKEDEEPFLYELSLNSLTTNPQLAEVDIRVNDFPSLVHADTGSLIRLKAILPPIVNKYFVISGFSSTMYPLVPDTPVARLSFEEFLDKRQDYQTLEIKSYRTWYLHSCRHIVGWMNTLPLTHCPDAVEVRMTTELILDPNASTMSLRSSRSTYYRFDLELLRGHLTVCSIPFINNTPQLSYLRISRESSDPLVLKFFQSFEVGDRIQIARFQSGPPSVVVKVSSFSLKLISMDIYPFCDSYNVAKAEALRPIVRDSQKAEIFCDPYDTEHFKNKVKGALGDMHTGSNDMEDNKEDNEEEEVTVKQ
eukprot:gene5734-6167_t